MRPELEEYKKSAQIEIQFVAHNLNDLYKMRNVYLSKNGLIAKLMGNIKNLNPDERKAYGQDLNELKTYLEDLFNNHIKI